jgi:transporter family protein
VNTEVSATYFSPWLVWALLSALFAALTAIFAKIGLNGVDSDYATLLRTLIIVVILATFVLVSGKWQNPASLNSRSILFLVLSALATGASWICYFRALKAGEAMRVAPIDKLSVVLVVIFAMIILGERPTLRDSLGILSIVLGAILLSLKS